jgi:hypothetical protein
MLVPDKLESYQNIFPTGHSNLIIAIYPNYQYNYYRENKQPKIANQVSQARYHIQLALRTGNTQFQSTEPHIWFFERKVTRSTNLNTSHYTGLQMTCNQYYWIDNTLRSSQKFESGQMHAQIIFYEFSNLTRLLKMAADF